MRNRRTLTLLAALMALLTLAAPAWGAPATTLVMGDGVSNGGTGGTGGTGGGTDGGSGGGGSGGGVAGTSTPRVMLTEFTAQPGEVTAGDAVEVTFTLQNMSRTTRVNNLKVTLTAADAGAFLPMNGSSSMYISTIKAEGSVTRTMSFRTLPTLEARPYGLTLQVDYEDAQANSFSSQEQVSIPIRQTQRADTSTFQVMPESIMVGQQASVTFSINNLGKTKLYNARVKVAEGQGVAAAESFVGNIDAGASGAVDMTLQAAQESTSPIRVEVTYEDANGKVTNMERELTLFITPQVNPEPFPPVEPEVPADSGLPMALLWGLAAVAVLIVLTVVIVRVRRRRRRSQQQDSDMALLDGDPLVPTDQG